MVGILDGVSVAVAVGVMGGLVVIVGALGVTKVAWAVRVASTAVSVGRVVGVARETLR